MSLIAKALVKQDYCHITQLLQNGQTFSLADINQDSLDRFGQPQVMNELALNGNLKSLKKYHAKFNKDVNLTNSTGFSPLMSAIIGNHLPTIEWLIEQRANLKHRNQRNECILHWVSRIGNPEVLGFCLTNMSESDIFQQINSQNDNGFTPLHFACAKGHAKIVRTLLSLGSDCFTENHYGATPLHWAANGQSLPMTETVQVILSYLAGRCSLQTIRSLLQHKNKIGFTPINWMEYFDNDTLLDEVTFKL